MARRRKAWLMGGDGIRRDNGKRRPGRYVRWTTPGPPGRPGQHSLCFCRGTDAENLRRARQWVRDFNNRLDSGMAEEITEITIRDAVVGFIASCATLAPDTRIHYASACAMLSAVVRDKPVCDITPTDIEAFIAARVRKMNTKATIARHLRSLKTFWTWCLRERYASVSPIIAARTPSLKAYSRKRPPVTDAQLGKLMEALDTEDRKIAVAIAMTAGLDRGVIERLSSTDIDIEQQAFRLKRPKTDNRVLAAIHPSILPLLVSRLCRTPTGHPLLRGLSRERADRDWWKTATKTAGCPDLWFRDLRALSASRLRRQGVSSKDVSTLLGHSYEQTTSDHYDIPSQDIVSAFQRLPIPGFPPPEAQTTG